MYDKYFKNLDKNLYFSDTLESLLGSILAEQTKSMPLLQIDKTSQHKMGKCWTPEICSSDIYRYSKCVGCRVQGKYTFKGIWDYVYDNNLVFQQVINAIMELNQ